MSVEMIELASKRVNSALEDVPFSSGASASATSLPEGTIEENAHGPIERTVEKTLPVAGRISVPLVSREPKAWILASLYTCIIVGIVYGLITFFLRYLK
jgi:hypothetical protein